MMVDVDRVLRTGLQPRAARPQTVIVVGAGMAGLTAALELMRAGHHPVVLEGRSRVGGRVHTLREPFAPGLHGEAGAMRIPRSHNLTIGYVDRFRLQLEPFTSFNAKAYCYVGGRRFRRRDVERRPEVLGFRLASHERGLTPRQLWRRAVGPILERLAQEGVAAWPWIVSEYDEFSTRQFLKLQGWSEGAIEMFGLLENQEARMNASFVEVLMEEVGGGFEDVFQIVGGMDRLPLALYGALGGHVRFGARMIAIDQTGDGVTVHYQNRAGRAMVGGDRAILTVPFSVLRHVDVLQPFSRGKQRAIRELHYDASGKIFLQCGRRFWEEDEGIDGGSSVTDLAIRNLYYPQHGRETGRGILLASYTWAEDAQRWGSLSPGDRIVEAIEDVAAIHPQVVEAYEAGTSVMWHEDEFACGAFALFLPGQKTLLQEEIRSPEGRIHFAGEHASTVHRWIQGAIESGLRAAHEVHQAGLREAAAGARVTV
jgi:monoamine oxidase